MREEQTQSVFKKEGAEEALRQKIKKQIVGQRKLHVDYIHVLDFKFPLRCS
jgi:DNA-dependent RNA polymerase auxiliary subunit epsilon